MSFYQAIANVFRNYFGFDGRATRREFWYWALFRYGIILTGVLFVILQAYAQGYHDGVLAAAPLKWSDGSASLIDYQPPLGMVMMAFLALTFIPNAAVSIRRLHDSGKSGWWFVALNLLPLGELVLFVFYLLKSSSGPNRFDVRRDLDPLLVPRTGAVFEA